MENALNFLDGASICPSWPSGANQIRGVAIEHCNGVARTGDGAHRYGPLFTVDSGNGGIPQTHHDQ
jgi:hypothetical protein